MPLSSSLVGRSTEPLVHDVTRRWVMAFAAGIGEAESRYYDTTSAQGLDVHPVFPVCLEWPAVLAARRLGDDALSPDERLRGVHAGHDLVLHRAVRADEELVTTATVVGVEARAPGAYEVLCLDTRTPEGEPVATTHMGNLFLSVDVDGADRPPELDPAPPVGDFTTVMQTQRHIATHAAHVYTECSRIYNPIHTDRAVAVRAGLPTIVLHGTATLAMAVSEVLGVHDLEPALVRRVLGDFHATVEIPSQIRVSTGEPVSDADDPSRSLVRFEVVNAHGEPAVRNGLLVLGLSER